VPECINTIDAHFFFIGAADINMTF
jgi:hypothetical protein